MGTCCSNHKAPPNSSSAADGHADAAPAVVTSSATSGNNQALSDKAPAPHMFHEIIADEKSTTTAAALEDKVYTGIYLAGKTKMYWVDEKTRSNCFMLFPRGLSITWSEDPRYWNWQPLEEAGDTEIEAASLLRVCWLEIQGKQELSHLTPGVNYEVLFEVMINESAYGWAVPVNLRLKFPHGTDQQLEEKLQEKPRGQWLKLKVGEVKTQQGQKGEMEISMFEHGSHWKSGLMIKSIKIIPKE